MKGSDFILFQWLRGQKEVLTRFYFLAVLQGIFYLCIPLSLQATVTYVMMGSFSASLLFLSFLAVAVVALAGYLQLWQMRINETLIQKLFGDLSERFARVLKENPLLQGEMDYANRYSEIPLIQKGISKVLLDFSFSLISIVFGLILLPLYNSWFFLVTIILSLAFYFIVAYYGKKGVQTNIKTSSAKYKIWDYFSSPDEKKSVESVEVKVKNWFTERNAHYQVLEKQYFGIIIFKVIFISILLFMGAWLVQIGQLNIGQFLASEIIIFLVINSVEKLVVSLGTFYDLNTSLYKLNSFLTHYNSSLLSPTGKAHFKIEHLVYQHPYGKKIIRFLKLVAVLGLVFIFLPWTQTVDAEGKVSTVDPGNRPQAITSRIAGRIERWYITEGKHVRKNDTIAFISEIKDEYIDPQLISRSEQMIASKETALESYEQKINSVNQQIDALTQTLKLKLEQTRNKLEQMRFKLRADSADAATAVANYKVVVEQFERFESLSQKGIISKTDLENRKIKVQDAQAKSTAALNKVLSAKNDIVNAEIELNSVQQDYQEKLMKAESDKFSALSSLYENEGALTKMQNQLANYNMRKGFYYVLAPQDGFIAKTSVQGIGEIISEGSPLCQIVPDQLEEAAELYVRPLDLPLIMVGQKVQLQFDGWPAFVFSGWPGMSYGTYQAEVIAFDKVLSDNGKFRVLVRRSGTRWPDPIQIGTGIKGTALLSNVPLIYELWRIINGFPPEFYATEKPVEKPVEKNEKK